MDGWMDSLRCAKKEKKVVGIDTVSGLTDDLSLTPTNGEVYEVLSFIRRYISQDASRRYQSFDKELFSVYAQDILR